MKNQHRIACLFIVFATLGGVAKADSSLSFSIPDKGGISFTSTGESATLTQGSARIQSTADAAPSGVAIFSFRQNDTLISETGVPITAAISSGRLFAHVS